MDSFFTIFFRNLIWEFFLCIFLSRDDDNYQLIQIYSVDWTHVYDTHTIEHRTEPVSH